MIGFVRRQRKQPHLSSVMRNLTPLSLDPISDLYSPSYARGLNVNVTVCGIKVTVVRRLFFLEDMSLSNMNN